MTRKNNLTFFEGAEVCETRNSQYYKVVLEEEQYTIYVNNKNVQDICEKCSEEAALVAILFAYIEYIRRDTSTDKDRIDRLDEKRVVESTVRLLKDYPIETLILYIKTLKWHEIQRIFESSNPKEEVEKIV